MSRFSNLGGGIYSGILEEISWFDANAAQPRLWPVLSCFGSGLGGGSGLGLGLESGVGLGLRPFLDPNRNQIPEQPTNLKILSSR